MNIFGQILPGLFDGFGGCNYNAVDFVFKINELSNEIKKAYWPLILKIVHIIKKEQSKKNESSNLVDANGNKIRSR